MALPVVLKSGKNYISLVLAEDIDFAELLQEIVIKFLESEKFFGGQELALMFEGRTLEEREKLIVLDAIAAYTSVHITRIIENDELKAAAVESILNPIPVVDISNAVQMNLKSDNDNCYLIDRDVLAGEKISSEHSIVVTGDVRSGAIIKAGENIIILGALSGQAIAGSNPYANEPYILAMEFDPENFRIGRILGKTRKGKKGVLKRRAGAKIAALIDGDIVITNY